MKHLSDWFRMGIFIGMTITIFASCDPQAENDLQSLINLVPDDTENPIEFIRDIITQSVELQEAINNSNKVGRRIPNQFAQLIINSKNQKCDTTRAVFFSLATLYESIIKIPADSLKDAGLAVVFGEYPELDATQMTTYGVDPNDYPLNYKGRNTVVLKYIKNMSDTDITKVLTLSDANGIVVDDLGKMCPNWCPPGFN